MARRFTLRQLDYLVAVGDAGSIAGAAERLNVSSPSISAAIAQLEAEFGLPLFIRRHAQGLLPTQSGQRLIAQARVVLAEAAALTTLAGEISGTVRGPLRVGCFLTFAQFVLPQLRRGFTDTWPEVAFTQQEMTQPTLIEALRRADLDVALTYDLDIPDDLEFLPLVSLPPYALLDEAHPLASRTSLSVADLAPCPMVLLDLPQSGAYFLSFFTAQGLVPQIAERTRDFATMRSLVANGFGYSLANIHPRSDLAPDGRPLRYVPLTGAPRPLVLGLVLMQGAQAPRTVRAFVDFCRSQITARSVPGIRLPEP